MNKKTGTVLFGIMVAWALTSGAICTGQPADSAEAPTGLLEIECNVSGVPLRLCPKDAYAPKKSRVFFGLIPTVTHICSGGERLVGETPLRPTPVPAGTYVLLIPSDYVWEREGPVEISVIAGKKTYFLLKLFGTRANSPEFDHGGGGGGGGGGAR